ncbi:hypothetical protein GPAL_1736 [Glaciecola pallidula DSM 14239 = ACAM 615]|uniref:Uncharacterized protein n=1 Tax=Brumicola pallidula DSM 14239 = ACAM 615 TaxID=1121922 RepID=K6Y739_9ALTE|nr:hypothetical protein GPAL_1736 [Glaciecola pallidula DSM 14239 = ACAM 615]
MAIRKCLVRPDFPAFPMDELKWGALRVRDSIKNTLAIR